MQEDQETIGTKGERAMPATSRDWVLIAESTPEHPANSGRCSSGPRPRREGEARRWRQIRRGDGTYPTILVQLMVENGVEEDGSAKSHTVESKTIVLRSRWYLPCLAISTTQSACATARPEAREPGHAYNKSKRLGTYHDVRRTLHGPG